MGAYASRLSALERERDELKARAERAEHERNEFRKLYELVLLELERMRRQLFGQKAETVDPAQVQLAFAPVLEALDRARAGGEAATGEVESELAKLRERAEAEGARPPAPLVRAQVVRSKYKTREAMAEAAPEAAATESTGTEIGVTEAIAAGSEALVTGKVDPEAMSGGNTSVGTGVVETV